MITVAIADLACVRGDTGEVIVTYALGSCVGICLYDEQTRIAGMVHVMLPWSKDAMNDNNKRRYADTGITELIGIMVSKGAMKSRIVAKIAGGAQMFGSASGTFNIGERNIEAVEHVLAAYKIPVIARDVGGSCARTLFLHSDTGMAEVKTAMRQMRSL
ncbi:MAG: chemotaxis protein CheD [Oscillospiraceae bacterium]|nr:chemotaxis protein CheD [Oscillospiraceae bacterium]